MHDFVAALTCHLSKVVQLRLVVLIESRYPHIKDGALAHFCRPFCFGADSYLAT
jgi:hypothetical protein